MGLKPRYAHPWTLVDIPMTLPRLRTHVKTLGKKREPKNFCLDRALGIALCSLSLHTDCCSPVITLCRLTRPDIRKLTSPLKTILTVKISSWSQKRDRKRDSEQKRSEPFCLDILLAAKYGTFNFSSSCEFAEFFGAVECGMLNYRVLVLLISMDCEKTSLDFHSH